MRKGVKKTYGGAGNTPGNGVPETTRQATGPRTAAGKARSRYNAVTHGFFANCLLPGESEREFKKLEQSFRKDYHPQTAIEEFLVSKLAMLTWQQRRLVTAEKREWSINPLFSQLKQTDAHFAEGFAWVKSEESRTLGLYYKKNNLAVLATCLNWLRACRTAIAENVAVSAADTRATLRMIYGEKGALCHPVCMAFESSFPESCSLANQPDSRQEEERKEKVKYVLEMLELEISQLESEKEQRLAVASMEEECRQGELLPSREKGELLLKYTASLERRFERTLAQLEGLQQVRKRQGSP